MGDIQPLSLETIEKMPVENRGTTVLNPAYSSINNKTTKLKDFQDEGVNGLFNRKKSVNEGYLSRFRDQSTIKLTDNLINYVKNRNLN